MTRELDVEVAEKVMGWKLERFDSGARWYFRDEKRGQWFPVGMIGEEWSPSTDISAAWLVVEKMRERGYAIKLRDWQSPFWGHVWDADFKYVRDDDPHTDGGVSGEADECKAICLAALVTMGHDDIAIKFITSRPALAAMGG